MSSAPNTTKTAQGFGRTDVERLPFPETDAMTEIQREAAQAFTSGPRATVAGPFIPLLQTPVLMERMGKLGEALRFEGSLPSATRELVICAVARETGNQFEWQTHAPLALDAGVQAQTIDALASGRRPHNLPASEQCALDFFYELVGRNGVSDHTFSEVLHLFGSTGAVELTTLVGYFVTVCWIMNVARTPGPAGARTEALSPFPL